MTLRFETFLGAEVSKLVDDLAALRISVFRAWPYLYEGDLEYERRYLMTFSAVEGIMVTAHAGEKLVGAATGLPLLHHPRELSTAVQSLGVCVEDTFCFAESVLLERHRGQGAGHFFFDAREEYARSRGFTYATFFAVQRPDDHPARPCHARSLEPFWRARGYVPVTGAIGPLSWRDIGALKETPKPMQFWMKHL